MRPTGFKLFALAMAVPALAVPALAVPGQRLIADYGTYRDIADAFEKPDPTLRYKIVFEVSNPARAPDKVHQGLERVARMANLLSIHGVDVKPGDLVVAIHGAAGRTILTQAAHAKRHEGAGNPNAELIRQLARAGISVRVCGQTVMAFGYAPEELNPDVHIDVSAITTIATKQLQGYALLPG